MRVLVTGAYGFIGSAIVARLKAEGHEIVSAGRRAGKAVRGHSDIRWIAINFAHATRPEDWLPHLKGIDAVVNCVGVLQDSPRDSTRAVHVEGTGALFAACERAGVRCVVHISAIGIGPDLDTEFARTKSAADKALMRRDLDWVILRPSLVVGRAVYGGTALIRALAAFPLFIPLANSDAVVQPVQIDEVAATAAFFLRQEAPKRVVLEIAGPERMTLAELVALYRNWLGLKPAPVAGVPEWLATILFRLGDAVSLLGWRPPIRTTSSHQLARGVTGNPAEWVRLTGISPRSLADALAAEPASVQERWFARLYLLKPIAIAGLALAWIAPSIFRLNAIWYTDWSYFMQGGLSAAFFVADAIAGMLFGIGLLVRASARYALWGMLAVLAFHVGGSFAFLSGPNFALLEGLIGLIPMVLVIAFTLAILDDR